MLKALKELLLIFIIALTISIATASIFLNIDVGTLLREVTISIINTQK